MCEDMVKHDVMTPLTALLREVRSSPVLLLAHPITLPPLHQQLSGNASALSTAGFTACRGCSRFLKKKNKVLTPCLLFKNRPVAIKQQLRQLVPELSVMPVCTSDL